jgi:DNA-binding beta-propeller fold protein YncE
MKKIVRCTSALCIAAHAACAPEATEQGQEDPGLAILGGPGDELADVLVEEIAGIEHGLNTPRDVAVHPTKDDQVWIMNRADDSMVIISGLGTDGQTQKIAKEPGNTHFMPEGSAFAFGAGTLATIHEEDQPTQGAATPADFMGPSLWDMNSDMFEGGHGTHLDMLHNSPNGMGIAWAGEGNAFWVFDGYHGSLSLYDFNADHGYGGPDHSDGEMYRYVEGEVKYEPDVPSHMAYDVDTGLLYVADTGNNRIAVLDTTTGVQGSPIYPNYDGGLQVAVDDAKLVTLIDGEAEYMSAPSGLELHDGKLFVSDNVTGEIQAFTLEGEFIDYIDTELESGALMGMGFDQSGRLYYVDSTGNKVMRISPK